MSPAATVDMPQKHSEFPCRAVERHPALVRRIGFFAAAVRCCARSIESACDYRGASMGGAPLVLAYRNPVDRRRRGCCQCRPLVVDGDAEAGRHLGRLASIAGWARHAGAAASARARTLPGLVVVLFTNP